MPKALAEIMVAFLRVAERGCRRDVLRCPSSQLGQRSSVEPRESAGGYLAELVCVAASCLASGCLGQKEKYERGNLLSVFLCSEAVVLGI